MIAACDSNLKRLADKGLFSRKLFEMVLDTVMRIPPLRERVKDISVLANHILAEMSAQYNMPQKHLSPEALKMLTGCSWPGNIKQLQGVIERAFFHVPGSLIEAEDIKMPVDKCLYLRMEIRRRQYFQTGLHAGRQPRNPVPVSEKI